MGKIFSGILEVSIYSGIMVCIVLLIRQIFKKASRTAICLLWILVGIRLLVFIPIESRNSIIPRIIPESIIRGLMQGDAENVSRNDFDESSMSVNTRSDTTELIEVVPTENNTISVTSSIGYFKDQNEPYTYEIQRDLFSQFTRTQEPGLNAVDKTEGLFNIAGVIWITGALSILTFGLVKALTLRKQLKTAVRLYSENNIYLTEKTESAFVFGLLRPRIYVGYVVNESDRAYLIAHEREHIRRKDQVIKYLGFILLSIYWFSPFIWIAFIMLCKDIELACDEGVIRSVSNDYIYQYADILYKYGLLSTKRRIGSVSFGEVSVKKRIKQIMSFKKKSIIVSVIACVLAITCLVVLLAPGATQAQELNEQSEEEQEATTAIITDTKPKSPWVANEESKDNGIKKIYYGNHLYSEVDEYGEGESIKSLDKYLNKDTLELYIPADIQEININDLTKFSYDQKNQSRPITIKVDEKNPVFDSRNDCNAIIETSTGMLVYGCDNTVIPDSVTSIFPQAFYNCRFKEISIPDSVSKIGGGAFWQCINLEKITLPSTLTEIEDWLFFQCGKLSQIVIPESVQRIGERAFANCGRLRNVTIKGNINNINIERWAFYRDYSLDANTKQAIMNANDEAYLLIEPAGDDISDVEYGKKVECREAANKTAVGFYAVLDTLDDDGTVSVRVINYIDRLDNYTYTGETGEYKLADDCKIVVKNKHILSDSKAYYLTKEDLKYITYWYVFVQPDGKIEPGEGAYEYVYPFLCEINEQGEIISLWENYP